MPCFHELIFLRDVSSLLVTTSLKAVVLRTAGPHMIGLLTLRSEEAIKFPWKGKPGNVKVRSCTYRNFSVINVLLLTPFIAT